MINARYLLSAADISVESTTVSEMDSSEYLEVISQPSQIQDFDEGSTFTDDTTAEVTIVNIVPVDATVSSEEISCPIDSNCDADSNTTVDFPIEGITSDSHLNVLGDSVNIIATDEFANDPETSIAEVSPDAICNASVDSTNDAENTPMPAVNALEIATNSAPITDSAVNFPEIATSSVSVTSTGVNTTDIATSSDSGSELPSNTSVEINATFSSIPVYIPSSASTVSNTSMPAPWKPSFKKESNESSFVTSKSAVNIEKKSKKLLQSEKYAAADAKLNNMLDAYIIPSSSSSVSDAILEAIEEPAELKPVDTTDILVEEIMPVIDETDEDWEVTAEKIESGKKAINLVPVLSTPTSIGATDAINSVIPSATITTTPIPEVTVTPEKKITRSLRPGGGSSNNLMKTITGPTTRVVNAKIIYQRDFILKQRNSLYPPSDTPYERPNHLSMYNNISFSEVVPSSPSSSTGTSSSASKAGNGGGRGIQSGRSPNTASAVTVEGTDSWKREPATYPQQHQQGSKYPSQQQQQQQGIVYQPSQQKQHAKRDTVVPIPPKKVVNDPVEVLSQQIRSILNKITPQTFDKLAGQIKDIKITASTLGNQLVNLIFEKAIYEQNFSNLYADLCLDLEKQIVLSGNASSPSIATGQQASSWTFIHVIYFRDSNQYSWVIDLDVDSNVLAGPYKSVKDCLASVSGEILPPMRSIPYKLQLQEIVVVNNILFKVYKNLSNSSEEQYFTNFFPVDEIPKEAMPPQRFSSLEDALKNARKKNSIKGKLLSLCQKEFMASSVKVRYFILGLLFRFITYTCNYSLINIKPWTWPLKN